MLSSDVGYDAVRIARQWLGTPYLHQASVKGVGTDCLGLIRGVWRGLYGDEPELPAFYSSDWGEYDASEPLLTGSHRHFLVDESVETLGQILLFRMRQGASVKHLGLVSAVGDAPAFIHAYDRHGVVESPLSGPWRRRIAARFRFPKP
ncbi:peptidase [Paracoccus albus]|uniref:peptidase n=1 Tax=Paracoccus albus TaxID=3017784 RepID=UPI0022F02921|nr:peptidase [Paracoccus albus]WBU61809.1 peptidase [Paracoccus albus]